MTAIALCCERCDTPVLDDPHWPHDPGCAGVLDDTCTCSTITCAGCCAECNPPAHPCPFVTAVIAGDTNRQDQLLAADGEAVEPAVAGLLRMWARRAAAGEAVPFDHQSSAAPASAGRRPDAPG